MDETRRQGSNLKWTVYYEDEEDFNYPVSRLVEDLNYLKKWFAWHPTFAHKSGKPVIFVWNEGNCEVASRWQAAAKQAGWYVVLKLFAKYRDCPFYSEIDSWHQYVSNYLRWRLHRTVISPLWSLRCTSQSISKFPCLLPAPRELPPATSKILRTPSTLRLDFGGPTKQHQMHRALGNKSFASGSP